MKLEIKQVGTVDVLTPSGALVDEDAEGFARELLERLRSANPRVVVCMHKVPYVDSVALEGLLSASEELAERALTLNLARVPSTCREILTLTDLDSKFCFFESVEDAVRSYI